MKNINVKDGIAYPLSDWPYHPKEKMNDLSERQYEKLCAAAIERSLETPFGDEEQIEVRDLLYQLICDHPNNCTDRMCNCKLKDGQYFIPDLPETEVQYQFRYKGNGTKLWTVCTKIIYDEQKTSIFEYRTIAVFKEPVKSAGLIKNIEINEQGNVLSQNIKPVVPTESDIQWAKEEMQNFKPERSDNELIESQEQLWNEVITDFGNFVDVEGLSSKFKLIRK